MIMVNGKKQKTKVKRKKLLNKNKLKKRKPPRKYMRNCYLKNN